jgi:hypothetical protein
LSWLAPRGIVAAAVSAMFAQILEASGMTGGPSLRAMVFLVIVTTVVVQGLPAGMVARILALGQKVSASTIVVGGNALGRMIARCLGGPEQGVVLVDADPEVCRAAEALGMRVILGSALEERTLRRAGVDNASILAAVTKNEGVNLLCARKANEDFRLRRVYAGVDRRRIGISENAVAETGVRLLFGASRDLRHWIGLCERDEATAECWRRKIRGELGDPRGEKHTMEEIQSLFLPLAVVRSGRRFVVDERWSIRLRDELWVAVARERAAEARTWLSANGWEPAPAQGSRT